MFILLDAGLTFYSKIFKPIKNLNNYANILSYVICYMSCNISIRTLTCALHSSPATWQCK